ncbi:MAG: helix-hairpin-helix domain-containing protein [Gammaproteobacteria bacterium]|nr:helix-hairpin-helix domain-containing protein [Gammaproteobacteria bacterium]
MKKMLLTVVSMLASASLFATPVNINKASAEEIAASLSGVGPAKAEAIVKFRDERKEPFTDVNQLLQVNGIGEKLLERIKADILFTD